MLLGLPRQLRTRPPLAADDHARHGGDRSQTLTRATSSASAEPPIGVATHRVRPRVAIVVLLDPGVPVVDVQVGVTPAVITGCGTVPGSCVSRPSRSGGRRQGDLVGAADVEVVADDLLEEDPAGRRFVQHLGQGELGLQDRQS